MSKGRLKNALNISHCYMEQVIRPGDMVVDATCGRGGDTAFLAGLVGKNGLVWAFDIQKEAIESTRLYLQAKGLNQQVRLLRDSHENVRKYMDGPIKAAMFNLGYLPGSNHDLKTLPQAVIKALGDILDMLQSGGAVSIVSYPGHEGGWEEIAALRSYVAKLPQQQYEIAEIKFLNQINQPPQAVIIEKL